jgi:prolyl-tRNA editing enzyme YbaK/EbsC (Cys-tRNA(Pro) deacylase)
MCASRSNKKVESYVKEHGLEARIVSFDESTKSSQLAAQVLGCTIAEIAKSIVFRAGDTAVIVILSGDKRVDVKRLQSLLGVRVSSADADAVRDLTGYVIGGVPPFPHDPSVRVLIDSSLKRFERVWASSGTPSSVVLLRVDQLAEVVGENWVDVSI